MRLVSDEAVIYCTPYVESEWNEGGTINMKGKQDDDKAYEIL
jgi:hypothetical protein